MSTSGRLSDVFQRSEIVPLDKRSKFILFSDCHRGDNSWEDDFAPNQQLLFYALVDYYLNGYTYIEVGDGDELWKNSNFDEIRKAHSHIYWIMGKFKRRGRLHLLWGNHNMEWNSPENVKQYYTYLNGHAEKQVNFFEDVHFVEGLRLKHQETSKSIFITHGHQGDWINDQGWRVGRFFVRLVWRRLQFLGVHDLTSPAQNYTKGDRVDANIAKWADTNRRITICGHTHRPRFPSKTAPLYFNTGSCVHPRCITGIEIQNNEIALIKWAINAGRRGNLCVEKTYLVGPENLDSIFQRAAEDPTTTQ